MAGRRRECTAPDSAGADRRRTLRAAAVHGRRAPPRRPTRAAAPSPLVAAGLLAVLALAGGRADAQLRPAQAGPAPGNLASLAKSPASLALAREFLALEPAPADAHYSRALGADARFRLDVYHPLDEIYGFVDALAARHKRRVQVFSIGQTAEGRPVKALELINNSTDPDFVWLDALTHAREWITGSTLLYALDQLVAGAPSGSAAPRSNQLPHSKNYIVVPVVNPDGYAYTWSTNRMWRKNRSPSPGSRCLGADLNRNFDHSFAGEGSSTEPCSHIYAGAYPFSEPETRALGDLMWSLRDRIKFYLTMHSYNQLWACPYAHTTEPSGSVREHMRVLKAIQRAVQETEGVLYEIGPLSTSLYVGSGFGIDFAYDKCGIQHSYLVELRDKGAHGFVLPREQIMPVARETFAGLRAGLKAVFAGR